MGALQEITTDFEAGEKATTADWFTDHTAAYTGVIIVQCVLGTACVPRYTIDGTNFFNLNSGQNVAADAWTTLFCYVKAGDTFNLSQASGGNVNVKVLRLYKA